MNDIVIFTLISLFIGAPSALLLMRWAFKNSIAFYTGVTIVVSGSVIASVGYTIAKLSLYHVIWGIPLAILTSVALLYYFRNKVSFPMEKITEDINLLCSGDLNLKYEQELQRTRVKEVKNIAGSLSKLQEIFRNIAAEMIDSSSEINNAGKSLDTISKQINSGVASQASSSEEASSAMEEMASNIEQNTGTSLQASELTKKMQDDIAKIHQATIESNKSLEDIISKINIINEIAQKTDLLAINAAIEAARAGEHGKGFSVVAGEVRKLAEESLKAADSINKISSDSMSKAENSATLINHILPDMDKVATIISEIANAGIEQNTGAQQVNQAVQELAAVTQQNAALAAEMTSNATSLEKQSVILKDRVSFFKISSHKTYNKETKKQKPVTQTNRQIKSSRTATNLNKSNKKVELKQTQIKTNLDKKKTEIKTNTVKTNLNVKKKQTEANKITTNTTNKTNKVVKQSVKPQPKKEVTKKTIERPKPQNTPMPSEQKGFTIDLGNEDLDDGFERF